MTPLFTAVELHLLDRGSGGIDGYEWHNAGTDGDGETWRDVPGGQLGLMGTVGLREVYAGALTVDVFWDTGWRNFEEAWGPVGWSNTVGLDAGVRWDRCQVPGRAPRKACLWLDVGAGPRVSMVTVRGWEAGISPAIGTRVGLGFGIGETRRVLVGVAATADVGWGTHYGSVRLVAGGFDWEADPGGPGLMLRIGVERGNTPES